MSTARKFHHRSYLRHPSEMPLLLLCESHPQGGLRRIHNVSLGGLACRSEASLSVGTRVIVQIPVVAPPFEARGEVVWCRRVDACYELGIQFSSEADAFAARMVEQLCYIERYRNEVLAREGRVIDSQTAASEWISKFAASFPHIS
jgi:hypothetical protein